MSASDTARAHPADAGATDWRNAGFGWIAAAAGICWATAIGFAVAWLNDLSNAVRTLGDRREPNTFYFAFALPAFVGALIITAAASRWRAPR